MLCCSQNCCVFLVWCARWLSSTSVILAVEYSSINEPLSCLKNSTKSLWFVLYACMNNGLLMCLPIAPNIVIDLPRDLFSTIFTGAVLHCHVFLLCIQQLKLDSSVLATLLFSFRKTFAIFKANDHRSCSFFKVIDYW